MKQLWLLIGRIAYWTAKPAIGMLVNGSLRTRVLVVHDGRILLVQNWLGDGSWVLPGGGRHAGEEAEAGALRELHEEAGIKLDPGSLKHMGTREFREKGFHFSYELFSVELAKLPTIKPQRFEVAALAWATREELEDYKLGEEVRTAVAAWPPKG